MVINVLHKKSIDVPPILIFSAYFKLVDGGSLQVIEGDEDSKFLLSSIVS